MTIEELKQCITAYGTDLYSFCRYLTRDRNEADDLYQDTFLLALEQVERLDETENVKSFLLSSAINLWRNKVRKRAGRNRIAGEVPLDSERQKEGGFYAAEDRVQTPEEAYLAKEKGRKLWEEVRMLPEHYRIVVLLHYMQGFNLKEIGRILSIPTGTVKSRLYQAKKRLRRSLEEQ